MVINLPTLNLLDIGLPWLLKGRPEGDLKDHSLGKTVL